MTARRWSHTCDRDHRICRRSVLELRDALLYADGGALELVNSTWALGASERMRMGGWPAGRGRVHACTCVHVAPPASAACVRLDV